MIPAQGGHPRTSDLTRDRQTLARVATLTMSYPVRRHLLSPPEAHAWLARGTLSSWPRDLARISAYAKQLVAGAWRPQPTDYIIMTTDGRLVHCGLWIAAIAESGLTLPVWVLELPLDVAQRLLDASPRGKGRGP